MRAGSRRGRPRASRVRCTAAQAERRPLQAPRPDPAVQRGPGRRAGRHGGARRRRLTMASTRDWFESIAEAERRAKRRLPKSVYSALVAGAECWTTAKDNLVAFQELQFIPRIATGLA